MAMVPKCQLDLQGEEMGINLAILSNEAYAIRHLVLLANDASFSASLQAAMM